ncbi:magnesium transporter CorA family protein [Streptomyces griseocarneus]|uniref:Magnesium transporter CorA n=1 Tax=Streptomyces griseocarneus TaxID=51201 RepID=A0ABX7RRS7_9ACTN|nr:CorA family divalent cation transporter [Streptomyces griseocarneus]QSY49599.1 hypothetical protein J3S04_00115 [Streptomyces griseocarneus]
MPVAAAIDLVEQWVAQVVDSYAPVVAELERDIEQIEATVFSGEIAPTERFYFLRREATDFYRAVHPLLAVLGRRLQPGRSPAGLQPYFRDVHDHLLLVNEEVAAQRDLLATVLEANIAVISVEQNKINLRQSATMERLTILASVFLPLSFVVGFFGQNFDWLVTRISGFTAFLVLTLCGLLLPCLLLFVWLYRRDRGMPPPMPHMTNAVHRTPAAPGAERSRVPMTELAARLGCVYEGCKGRQDFR